MKKPIPLFFILCILFSFVYTPVGAASVSAPKAPTQLTATVFSYDSICLTWKSVQGARGYSIYYLSSGKYVHLTDVKGTSYTDNTLSEQTSYTYKVRAYIISGAKKIYGAYSSAISVKTYSNISFTVEPMSDTSILIRWDNTNAATGFAVYYSKSMVGSYKLINATTEKTLTQTGLTPNTRYYYKVKYYNQTAKGKQYSEFSAPTSALTLPKGKKYETYLFMGNSLTGVPNTPFYFEKLCDAGHQYIRVLLDVQGGAQLSDLLRTFQRLDRNPYTDASTVILQEFGGAYIQSETAKSIQGIQKWFAPNTKYYFLTSVAYKMEGADMDFMKNLNVSGVEMFKTYNLCETLFNKQPDTLFRVPNDFHPNELYGYASALVIYCTLYHADPLKQPHNFVRSALIPGQTKAEKDAFILDIKTAVSEALKK